MALIYEVSEGGETLRIELHEVGEGVYDLTVGGETVRVDAAKSGRTIYSVIEDGRQFEAMVEERGAHGFDILVSGRIHHLEAVDERSRLLAEQARTVATGPQTVEAEMPGKIVKVHLSVGAPVRVGQGVVVVEAMKMENEIRSPIDGVVKEISVSEEQTVETGQVLFVVEPPEAA
ncbi:MAG: biotin/lipoyl-containing protein [Myxococcota bacterium]